MTAQTIDNTDKAAIYSDENLLLTAGKSLVNDDSVVKAGKDADLQAASLTGTGAEITAGGRLTASAGVINNTNTNLAAKESVSLTALGSIKNQNTAIYADKDLTIKAAALLNKTSLLAAGGQTGLSTGILENTDSSVIYGSSDMNIAASDYLLNSSSDIESGQNLCITAGRLTNEKTAFDTDWTITHQDISYGIAHWNGNYYSASRRFDREIKTGTIEKETPTAHITADKNVAVTVNKLVNHYSEITAGTDLAINAADSLENLGYQGTIIATDTGNDYQNWKYKKKGRWWKHSHWVYGTTVVPYYDQNITDETTQRAGILSGGARVNITAPQIKNITYDAGKNEITQRPAAATASADRTLIDARLIQYAGTDSHRFCINKDPSAKYLIETNPRFADYHSFLSSDYLLQRIKNDPEKVMKRLGDGYYEQKLVTDQITGLTGRRYLDNYSSALDQYKALMDNGAAFAQKYDLTTGVALSKEQMAELTCDIVWLVKENINGQDVLVPKVYLSSLKNGDLRQSGALITGTDVTLISPKDLQNIGTIKADKDLTIKSGSLENKNAVVVGGDIAIKADGDVENSGAVINGQNVSIAAQNIINNTRTVTTQYRQLSQTLLGSTASINAAKDLTLSAAASIEDKGGTLAAGQGLVLTAQKDINIENISQKQHVAVAYGSSSAELSSVENFGSNIAAGGDISITGTKVTLKASSLDAGGKAAVTAEKDIDITDAKDDNESDIAVGSRGGSYFARQKHDDETVVGAAVSAAGDIAIKSGGSVDIKGSAITSDKGAVSLAAQGNINLVNDTGHHESIYELHKKDKGFLASKTTDIYDYKSSDDVVKSSIEGKDIAGLADKDINITGSSAVADNDVSLKAGGDINIISAEEQSGSTYYRSVKKSGLLSGGGLGFTIGKESAKDKLQNTDTEQIAATVGSIGGSVDIAAGSKAAVKGSDIMAGKDINITAGQVDIQNTDNVYTSKEDHEYKKSGLTVSIGGQAVKTADDITAPVQRIGQVEDDRLKALYAKKAYDQIKDAKDTIRDINKKGIKSAISIDVSLGSSKSESHSTSTDIEAKGSSISAAKDVSITANKTDINIKGSTVAGNNITLDAKRDINLTAAQNSNKTDSTASSASSSIGASIGLAGGVSYNARLEKNSSATRENTTAYTNTEVTAGDTLKTNSGEDTTITGAKASGGKVEMNVGRDLAIKSLQDADDYNEHNSSSGIAIATGGTNASADKGRIDSDYQSTADQSGIYAGKDGFDITVGKNTDLKGAVIDSDAAPDKNKLSTDTLTYSDIDNKASYDSKNTGVNYNTGKDVKPKDKGLTPDIGVEAKGNAAGTTKSAIAPGTIDIRGNPGQDISGLSRDTKDALNKLGKIFDKDKILEKQELAKLFGEEIFKTIGDLGLKDGSPEKTALDAFAGGIMSKLGGSSFVAGAAGAGINEVIIKELGEIRDPAVMQWASAAVGAAAAKVTGGSAAAGAGAAASETKNNWLSHEQVQAFEDRASQIQSEYLAGEITESEEKKLMIELGRTYRIIDIIQSDNSYYNEFKDDNGQAWETGVYMADPFRFIGILKGNPSYNENLFNDTENYAINSYFANHPVTLYDLGVITPQGNSIIKTLSMIQKPAWLIMFTRHWI
ncbi:hemagglutinin repeat-containing protein [Pectinatus frisingensis]|uniref:hemagglutinin repeat-containing protein n=1 Tax=Pectinatus frisingensis TaxID=865 RepID=UPI00389951A5